MEYLVDDPNGPFYDERHGVWHLFFQDHLAEANSVNGGGPVWGHAASRDLAHWAKLPVAMWYVLDAPCTLCTVCSLRDH
jgi:sucrose-6-phosphate hydrolase SacC (GH32 family)